MGRTAAGTLLASYMLGVAAFLRQLLRSRQSRKSPLRIHIRESSERRRPVNLRRAFPKLEAC